MISEMTKNNCSFCSSISASAILLDGEMYLLQLINCSSNGQGERGADFHENTGYRSEASFFEVQRTTKAILIGQIKVERGIVARTASVAVRICPAAVASTVFIRAGVRFYPIAAHFSNMVVCIAEP
ncbi:hypothetical protein D3H35_02685 [Cohnella faecalis]|uniref:Uncharacterized protein n=1 Tax=Cohnella faecalis TaxID=2315694 RepID=A0A398CR64_9BACL|nr:hypothetical protein D3H35_02685 [Cohnella faecalis]